MKKFFLQVIGLGPAGLGPFLVADQTGNLSDLLSRGVAWFDTKAIGCAGRIGNYRIVSNSPVGDYLETINPSGLFGSVLNTPIGKFLKTQEMNSQVPLPLVGEFAVELQKRLAEIVLEFPQSQIYTEKEVGSISWDDNNFTTFTGDQSLAVSETILLACGAREQIKPELYCLSRKVLLSSDVICDRVQCGQNIHIVGGSHSMASVIWKLREKKKNYQVTVWHRSPVKFFYPSVVSAVISGYIFKEEDVCQKTGRVHRFGGIRPPYREIVQDANCDGWVQFKNFDSLESIISDLSLSDTVIQATGFNANRIPIIGNNTHNGPLMTSNGHLVVDKDCCVYCECGCRGVIQGAYALGLGHQPLPSPEFGGELSYKGSVDGFNVYAGNAGRTIIRSLLKNI